MSKQPKTEKNKADSYILVAYQIRGHEHDQCCGSGMFIPDPDYYPSRISDPGSKNINKREG
jgi:hypothetical protein